MQRQAVFTNEVSDLRRPVRNNKGRNLLRVMVLLVCFVALSNQHVWACNNSTVGRPVPSPHELSTDEVDEVMQSAKAAIAIINQNIKTKNDELTSLIAQMQASISQVEDAASVKQIKSILDGIIEAKAKLKGPIEAIPIEDRIGYLRDLIFKLNVMKEEIRRIEERIEEESAGALIKPVLEKAIAHNKRAMRSVLVGLMQGAAAAILIVGIGQAAGAYPALNVISKDRIKAAKFIELVRSNNRIALSDMLKREVPGSDVDVREVKDTSGLMAIFRINGVTHCLSTKTQCGGKRYSVSN